MMLLLTIVAAIIVAVIILANFESFLKIIGWLLLIVVLAGLILFAAVLP